MDEAIYTVVTFYQREAHTKPVVHSYGPYTRSQALTQSRKWRHEYLNITGTFHCHATKILSGHVEDEPSPSIKGGHG